MCVYIYICVWLFVWVSVFACCGFSCEFKFFEVVRFILFFPSFLFLLCNVIFCFSVVVNCFILTIFKMYFFDVFFRCGGLLLCLVLSVCVGLTGFQDCVTPILCDSFFL